MPIFGTMAPIQCLENLTSQSLSSLDKLPDSSGIYALADHFGSLHYIGMTASPKNFRDRIYHRHINGSEKNSHKLACNYNVGRMWRDRDDRRCNEADARLAKALRKEFIRRYCMVAFVEISLPKLQLKKLEKEVIRLADPSIKDWNNTRKRVSTFSEPRDLVDTVLDELGWSKLQRDALDRQAALYDSLTNSTLA